MEKVLVIGLGGFLGAIGRYGLSAWTYRHVSGSFPLGTLVVNVLGCLVIGAFMAWVEGRPELWGHARDFLLIGVLGAFTTFSTFGYDTFDLWRTGRTGLAVANVAANVLVGLGAVLAGYHVVRVFLGS